jgi:foldase protein PrsA
MPYPPVRWAKTKSAKTCALTDLRKVAMIKAVVSKARSLEKYELRVNDLCAALSRQENQLSYPKRRGSTCKGGASILAKKSGTNMVVAVVLSLAVAGIGGYMVGHRTGQNAGDLKQEVVGSVNGVKITKNDLYNEMLPQVGKNTLDTMITDKLIDEATKGVDVTAAQVNKEIEKIKTNFPSEAEFQAKLAEQGYTLDTLKEKLQRIEKAKKLLTKDLALDDAALKKYFEENKATYEAKAEVKARHILVKTEDEAKAIKAELDKGTDFAALAKEKSIDPSAQQNAGDLGFNPRGNMVKEFDEVVFNLKKGEISNPFKSEFGWHVAQAVEIKPAPTFEEAKAELKDELINKEFSEKIGPWLEELKQKAKIENTLEPKKS